MEIQSESRLSTAGKHVALAIYSDTGERLLPLGSCVYFSREGIDEIGR